MNWINTKYDICLNCGQAIRVLGKAYLWYHIANASTACQTRVLSRHRAKTARPSNRAVYIWHEELVPTYHFILYCTACGLRAGVNSSPTNRCRCTQADELACIAYLTQCPDGCVFTKDEELA